jgi:uncharacterized OB-fold protein
MTALDTGAILTVLTMANILANVHKRRIADIAKVRVGKKVKAKMCRIAEMI